MIERITATGDITSMHVAAAYVTTGGAGDILRTLRNAIGARWDAVEKCWLTSFDYLRTEPLALRALMSAPKSSVRINDAKFCLTHNGMPRTPFHPKVFLFRSTDRDYAIAGSGNISRSGLSRGIEAGLAVGANRDGVIEHPSFAAVQELREWFTTHWRSAASLNELLITKYATLFESAENLKKAVPTEDDVATSDIGARTITADGLRKLRVCRHLWIEAGNITKNLGRDVPGNQLMMKRLSRVYFGFQPTALPENSPIGQVEISFNGHSDQYSLTFSDNGMDKLVLPIPGRGGPPAYDNQNLLFERIGPNSFRLKLGSRAEKARWLRKSRLISGDFRMSSGREWGVF